MKKLLQTQLHFFLISFMYFHFLARFFDGWYPPPGTMKDIIKRNFKRNKLNLVEGEALNTPSEVRCNKKPLFIPHCDEKRNKPCLFNLKTDPCEFHDVSQDYPIIYNIMIRKLNDYKRRMVKSRRTMKADPESNPKLHKGAWVSWKDKPKRKRSFLGLNWLFPFRCE